MYRLEVDRFLILAIHAWQPGFGGKGDKTLGEELGNKLRE